MVKTARYNVKSVNMAVLIPIVYSLLMSGCSETIADPYAPTASLWEKVLPLEGLDIRSINEHDGSLLITANQRTDSGNYGLIYQTIDGNTWYLLKMFNSYISPITFHGDTMVVTNIDSVWKYHPSHGWETVCKLPFLGSDDVYDLFYLNNSLYVMAVRFWRYIGNGAFQEILFPQKGGKFLLRNIGMGEIAYFRPWAYASKFYSFDGERFYEMTDGLTEDEKNSSTVDAMTVYHDTLYAGFFHPGNIKYYSNNIWHSYTDTLPYSKMAFNFSPIIKTRPTVMSIVDGVCYVGTDYIGILKWDRSRTWSNISEGLPKLQLDYDVYRAVNFLQYYKGFLYTGYGQPTFSPYFGPTGVYRYKLQ